MTSAGKYHMGKGNVNNCTTSVCGNTISQQCVESMSGSAVINVTSDMFASNFPVHELTVPNFYDSSKQRVLHFLCDLYEYYRIKMSLNP